MCTTLTLIKVVFLQMEMEVDEDLGAQVPFVAAARKRRIVEAGVINVRNFCRFAGWAMAGATAPGHNYFMSPIAVYRLLVSLYEISDGRTSREIRRVMRLRIDGMTSELIRSTLELINSEDADNVRIGTGINIMKGRIDGTLAEVVEDFYFTFVSSCFFAEPNSVVVKTNAYVAESTDNHITDVLDASDFNIDTRILGVSAACYTGQWLYYFEPNDTNEELFQLASGETVNVQMMSKRGFYPYAYNEHLASQMVLIPFMPSKFSMIIFLPVDSSSVALLHQKLITINLEDLVQTMPRDQPVSIKLPKFRFENKVDLLNLMREVKINILLYRVFH